MVFSQKLLIFYLFLYENICCGYSLEAPHRGASNEYPQHMFLGRNKKNIYQYCSYWENFIQCLIILPGGIQEHYDNVKMQKIVLSK